MSAAAFIKTYDVPPAVMATRSLRNDEASGDVLIAFDGCPLVGIVREELFVDGHVKPEAVEFPFPRVAALREQLIDWLMYYGISFTVVM